MIKNCFFKYINSSVFLYCFLIRIPEVDKYVCDDMKIVRKVQFEKEILYI